MKIEICLESAEAAFAAQEHGANRVELCANLQVGGTTPNAGTIFMTRKLIDIPLFVLIRPRGGDFCYNRNEIEQMKYNIQLCKSLGVDGVVIGLLNKNGTVDVATTKELVDLARPMQVTFHRAFDRCLNPLEALEQLIDIGVNRILTSGQTPKAMDGIVLLTELVEKAGNRIIIMPGSGVNSDNINELITTTKAKEIHFSAHQWEAKEAIFIHPNFDAKTYEQLVFNPQKIQSCLEAIQGLVNS